MPSATVTEEKFAFSQPKNVWETYLKHRPPYPDSMFKMWLDYHNGPLNTIHELGTGCGVGAAGLLRVAQAVRGKPIPLAILSDPTAQNVATTRALLTSDDASNGATRFEFHQQPGEATFLAPGSVDLVFACECLHWTDVDACAASVHASLRAGGTFAAVTYDLSMARVQGDAAATAAYGRAYQAMIAGVRAGRHATRLPDGALADLYKTRRAAHALNIVPLGADRWADATRVYLNVEKGVWRWPQREIVRNAAGDVLEGPVRVDEKNDKMEWIQDTDSWGMKECTADWVRGMLLTAPVDFHPSFWEEPPWTDFVAATEKNGGKFCFVFRANYIMARKR